MKNISGPPKRYPVVLISESKLFIAKLNGANTAFTHFVEMNLPPGLVSGGEVRNCTQLSQILLTAKRQSGLKETKVIVGVPETKATTHSLILPALANEEIEQAIQHEAPEFLPFSVQDEYMDWMVVNKLADDHQAVLISAIPKTVIDGFSQAVLGAGLSPVAFESTSITLFYLIPHARRNNVLAAEIGDQSTVVILMIQGTIEAVSVIPGNENVVEKLAKMVQFFIDEKTEGKVPDELFVSGKNASSSYVSQIAAQLHIKTSYLHAKLPKIPEAKQVEYALLYCLSTKPVTTPDDTKTITVLPNDLVMKYQETNRKKLERLMKSLFIAAILAFIGITLQSFMAISDAREAIERRSVNVKQKNTQSSSVAYSPAKISVLGEIDTANENLLHSLKLVYAKIPPSVTVEGVQYDADKGELLLAGKAANRTLLLDYKKALEETNSFVSVVIPLSSLEKDVDVNYRIVLSLQKPTTQKTSSNPASTAVKK